jgi:hypothetical protein
MADANRLQVVCVREATFGTTPNTPRMRTARLTGESLAFEQKFIQSNELRSDRMNSDPVKINENNAGAINFELSYPEDESVFSEFLRSLMYNPWVVTATRDNDGTADSIITNIATTNEVATVLTGTSFVAGQLAKFSGFGVAGNNGVFKCTTGSATVPRFIGAGLTDEAVPPAAAKIKVVGFQGAAADITATATGLGSTLLDFTTLGLAVGMWAKVGGSAAGDKFATAALNDWMRISAIAANALTFDNRPSGWTTDAGTGKTIKVWFGDYVKNGTTRTSLSIEKGFLDQVTPTYILQKGMIAGQADFDFAADAIITGSMTFQGLTGSQSTTAQDASPDAATTNTSLSANSNVGRIAEGGVTVASPNFIKSMKLTVNNNLRPITAVGNVGSVAVGTGEFGVSGSIETYFGDNTLLAKLINQTATSLNARAQLNSQAIIFDLPRVTFTGGSAVASGKNTDITLPLSFQVSIDTTTNAHLLINRIPYYEA